MTEPSERADEGPAGEALPPDRPRAGGALPLETDLEPARCHECGEPLRAGETTCLRCAPPRPSVAPRAADDRREPDAPERGDGAEGAPEEGDEEGAPALVAPRDSDRWLPWAIAGAVAIALVVGSLAGARALFPDVAAPGDGAAPATIPWALRLEALLRIPIGLVLWTVCGFVGLGALSWLEERPMGSASAAALRVLAITAVARLVTLLDLPWRAGEAIAEAILAASMFILMAMVMLRMPPRLAAILLGLTTLAFVVAYAFAWLVVWAGT